MLQTLQMKKSKSYFQGLLGDHWQTKQQNSLSAAYNASSVSFLIIIIRQVFNMLLRKKCIFHRHCKDNTFEKHFFPSVQFSSVAQSCPTLCDPMNRSTPGLPVHHHSQSSLKLTSIESVMPSSHLILCRPLFPLPPCQGPAPVDPGNSKGRRRWRGKTCLFINIRLD